MNDLRPCAVCGKPAEAQGTLHGGPPLCDEPCFYLFWKDLTKHPKRKVVAVQMEPGQEQGWWDTYWWYFTLSCGCVVLSYGRDTGYPWLHCFQCPIEEPPNNSRDGERPVCILPDGSPLYSPVWQPHFTPTKPTPRLFPDRQIPACPLPGESDRTTPAKS